MLRDLRAAMSVPDNFQYIRIPLQRLRDEVCPSTPHLGL